MKHQAISDDEFRSLTDLPPLGQTHIERAHCSSCGGTLAPGETGKCPACEGAGGGRKNHQRQKQVRTNGGGVEKSAIGVRFPACRECGQTDHHTGQHWFGEPEGDEPHAYIEDGIYCKNCVEHGDERWGKPEHYTRGEDGKITLRELEAKVPHGVTCDNCMSEITEPRDHTEDECENGSECHDLPENGGQGHIEEHEVPRFTHDEPEDTSWHGGPMPSGRPGVSPVVEPYRPTPTHERGRVTEDIQRDLRDAEHEPPDTEGDHVQMGFSHHDLPQDGESFEDWMGRTTPSTSRTKCTACKGKGTVRAKGPVPAGVNPWEHRTDCATCGGSGAVNINRTSMSTRALYRRFQKGLQMKAQRKFAYGETKAPQQVDTLRDDTCPVCGDSDSYDGDQCQVCGYVTPPKMFQDPDLAKAKLLDLRADPATGAPNDTDPNVGSNLPPVDPSAVDEQGNVIGDGGEADAAEAQTGVVEGEVEGLGDAGADPNAAPSAEPGGAMDPQADAQEPGADTDEDGVPDDQEQPVKQDAEDAGIGQEPGAPEDLDDNGEFANQEPGGGAPEQAEESAAEPNSPGPEDPAAAEQRVNQGGEAFTPGPNAPEPAEPMEPGVTQAVDDEEAAEAGVPEQGDGQVEGTGSEGVPGTPGDGVADLLCPACGFEAGAAAPTSTSMDPQAPTGGGDGMLEGDICPNCQKATLMGTGQVQQAEQAGLMP